MEQQNQVQFTTKSRVAPSQKIYDYVLKQLRLTKPQIDLINETQQQMPRDISVMQCSPEQIEFFRILMKITNSKKGIEVGTFTGLSALGLALGLPKDGKLICCDVSEKYTNIGKKYWQAAGVDKIIDLRIAPGTETIAKLLTTEKETFDFGFVDADKGNYKNYYEGILQLLKPGGFIMFDNVLWDGYAPEDPQDIEKVITEVLNNEPTFKNKPEELKKEIEFNIKTTKIFQEFNEFVAKDDRVESVMITVADGLTIVRKK